MQDLSYEKGDHSVIHSFSAPCPISSFDDGFHALYIPTFNFNISSLGGLMYQILIHLLFSITKQHHGIIQCNSLDDHESLLYQRTHPYSHLVCKIGTIPYIWNTPEKGWLNTLHTLQFLKSHQGAILKAHIQHVVFGNFRNELLLDHFNVKMTLLKWITLQKVKKRNSPLLLIIVSHLYPGGLDKSLGSTPLFHVVRANFS